MIFIKRLRGDFELPKYQTEGSAGFDLQAELDGKESVEIAPGEVAIIGTGFAFQLQAGWEMQIRPRSGLAAKQGITVLNAPGTIDSDYRGEVKVILINHSKLLQTIKHGDRIAQGVLSLIHKDELVEVGELDETERGSGGFGSTGK